MLHQYKGERIPPYKPLSHLLSLNSLFLSLDLLISCHREEQSDVAISLFLYRHPGNL